MRSHTAKIKIGDKYAEESKNGKLLGINVDNNLTMVDHIKYICKQASSKLYALARISHFLNDHKSKVLMKSFIISQFNYCLLFGCTAKKIQYPNTVSIHQRNRLNCILWNRNL